MSTEALIIRPYAPLDEPAVVRLWEAAFPNEGAWNAPRAVITLKRQVQPELFLVGVLDGQLVASCIAGFDGVRGWIHRLAVLADQQRQGLGTRMLEAAIRGLSEAGCPKVNLQVRGDDPALVTFYERNGFSIEERVSLGRAI